MADATWPANTPPPGSYGDFTILGRSEQNELFPQLGAYGVAVMQKNGYYYELADNPSPGQSANVVRVLADPRPTLITYAQAQTALVPTNPVYATPTPQLGGGSLLVPSPDDAVITGTIEGTPAPAMVSEPNIVGSSVVSDGKIPTWAIVAALVLLVLLVLKDK